MPLYGSAPNVVADEWAMRKCLAGWHPQAVAVAAGCSERTVYRWRLSLLRIETVMVAGYETAFAIYRRRPPMQLAPWRRV